MSFSIVKRSEISETRCPICYDEWHEKDELVGHRFSDTVIHGFHKKCLIKWFSNRETCPLCNVKAINKIALSFVEQFKLQGAVNLKQLKFAILTLSVVGGIISLPRSFPKAVFFGTGFILGSNQRPGRIGLIAGELLMEYGIRYATGLSSFGFYAASGSLLAIFLNVLKLRI